jgi:hypothetical protein
VQCRYTGLFLGTPNGNKISASEFKNVTSQLWTFYQNDDLTFGIRNARFGNYLESDSEGQLFAKPWNNGPYQRWFVFYTIDGAQENGFHITNPNNYKALEGISSNDTFFLNIPNGGSYQTFDIYKN